MAGGTQTTYTSTEPWEAQQGYLEKGMARAEDLYQSGRFTPEFYGAPGTASGNAQNIAQVAPGLAGFNPDQYRAMEEAYNYAMGPRVAGLSSAAEDAFTGGILPYSSRAMGVGDISRQLGGGPQGYAQALPFEGDQYERMVRGEVDYTPYNALADVYRQQFEDQTAEGLKNVRQGIISHQPGGGSRGDIYAANVASAGQKALAQNLAGLYGGAYERAQAGRMPAAQMGLGQQQFGMGYGLEGMRGMQTGLGLYPGLVSTPFGAYGQAQEIGGQQRALQQAALDRDVARYQYQAGLPSQGLQSYLAGVTGDYGGMSTATGAGGTGVGENILALLAAKAIGL
jgi:hypothetical protein